MVVSVMERVEEEEREKNITPPLVELEDAQEVMVQLVIEREEEMVEPTENREGSDDVEVTEVNKEEVKITDGTPSSVLE